MPTSTNVTNLKINELTEAQYDTAVSGGVIGANELSILTDVDEAIQVSTMPTAGADELGKVYQFIGTTDANYTHGYFYECTGAGEPVVYSWSRVDVQPSSSLPSQTGNAGKFLTTDGTDASWSNNISFTDNNVSPYGTVKIGIKATVTNYSVSVGFISKAYQHCVAMGNRAQAGSSSNSYSIAIGSTAQATGSNCIQLGSISYGSATTNSDNNTFKVANANGNYEIMSADGTIPTDRFTTTPSADGTYYPTLSISSGTATRSWGTISALQNTATGNFGFSTGSAVASGVNSVALGNSATSTSNSGIAIGSRASSTGIGSVAIGTDTVATKEGSVLIGAGSTQNNGCLIIGKSQTGFPQGSIFLNATDSAPVTSNLSQNTFYVGLKYNGSTQKYALMSEDGTIPAARHASLPATDGTYVLKLVISGGVPTLSWVAE